MSRLPILTCLLLLLPVCAPGAATGVAPGAAQPSVLVLGDSLSAAYGMPREAGWVALLRQRLAARNPPTRVVNASVSGTTTGATLARIEPLLAQHRPTLCIIELGANDGLRGQPTELMAANLRQLVLGCRDTGARVLLIGMRIPPNYGRRYADAFAAVYRTLAEQEQITLVPFFLDGVVQRPEWMQDDALHPTAAAQPALLDKVWDPIVALLDSASPSHFPGAGTHHGPTLAPAAISTTEPR